MSEGVKKGSIYMFVGLVFAALFRFGFYIYSARILGPKEFGLISVLFSAVIIASEVLMKGIFTTMGKFVSETEAKNEYKCTSIIIKQGLKYELCLIVGFIALSLIFKDFVVLNLFNGNFTLYLIFLISGTLYGFSGVFRGALQGYRKMKYLSIIQTVESFTRFLSLIILIGLGLGIIGVAISIAVAPLLALIGAFLLYQITKRKIIPQKNESNESKIDLKYDLKAIVNFALPVSIILVSGMFLLNSGPIIIKLLAKKNEYESAGIFMAALILTRIPIYLSNALFYSLFPNISRAHTLGKKDLLEKYIKKSSFFICIMSCSMIIGVWFFGPIIMEFIYGDGFFIERIHLVLLSIMTGFYLMASLFTQINLARGYVKTTLISWILSIVIFFIVIIFPISLFYRIEFALISSSLTAFFLLIKGYKNY